MAETKSSEMPRRSGRIDMTEGSIWKSLILFSLPLILGNLLQQLYNTADSVIVGMYVGNNGFAAVSASTFIIGFMIAFSMGVAAGAGVVISHFIGAGDADRVRKAVHTALTFSGLLGLVLSLAGVLLSRKIMLWMDVPPEMLEEAVVYFQLYSAGLVFSIIYNMAAGILNATGDSKRPLLYLAVASVVNIALDFALIAGLKTGVSGAAVATDVSQLLSCVLILRFLMRSSGPCRVRLRSLGMNRAILAGVIGVGLPTGVQNMMISLSNMFVQTSVNRFGVDAVAGYGAYMKIDGFNILPMLSLGLAMMTFAGQNYGAGKIDRIRDGMRVTLILTFGYSILTTGLILTFAAPLIRLFTPEKAAIAYGVLMARNLAPVYLVQGVIQVLGGAVRGVGKAVPPMLILLFAFCVCRIVWLTFFAPSFHHIESVFGVYPASIIFGMILTVVYVWKWDWLKEKSL